MVSLFGTPQEESIPRSNYPDLSNNLLAKAPTTEGGNP